MLCYVACSEDINYAYALLIGFTPVILQRILSQHRLFLSIVQHPAAVVILRRTAQLYFLVTHLHSFSHRKNRSTH